MNEQKFTELLGQIDPALIARAEESVPMRQKPIFRRALIAAVAAMLALTMCASLVVIPFIPTTLGLDYLTSPSDGTETAFKEQNAWIYYVENGKQKREYVRLPGDTQNVFMAWKHLNAVGDEVELLDYRFESDHAQAAVVPDTLWEYLQQAFSPASGTVSVTLSPEIKSCENYDTLIKSLTETLAKFAGVDPEQVKIMIDGEQSILAGGLKFYHNLHLQDQLVFAGGQMVITVGMTNVSDYDIEFTGAWSDFAPKAKLRADTIIYVEHLLLPLPNDSTTEIAEYRLAPGESREVTYTFDIPENAELGAYDLIVSFGEQSKTFENVTTVIYAYAAEGAKSAFKDFTLAHTSEDRTELQSIWDSYSYQGKNIMEQISVWSGDGENYWFEQGEYNQFSYFSSRAQMEYGWLSHYSQSFTARALPDGMELPMGITEQDSILEALIKLGIDDQTASDYLAQEGVIILAGPSVTSSIIEDYSGTIELVCDQTGYTIVYTCQKGIIAEDDPYPHATRSFSLHYALDRQYFLSICLNVDLPTRPNVIFDALPTFTEVDGKETSITLTQEQTDALHQAMTKGKWQSYEADAEYDCQGMVGHIEFEYASATGHLTVGGFTVTLSGKERIELNKILGIPLTLE